MLESAASSNPYIETQTAHEIGTWTLRVYKPYIPGIAGLLSKRLSLKSFSLQSSQKNTTLQQRFCFTPQLQPKERQDGACAGVSTNEGSGDGWQGFLEGGVSGNRLFRIGCCCIWQVRI